MRLPTPSVASAKANTIKLLKWVASGGLLVALIMAVVQCSVERQKANRATIQTYNMTRVAAFNDSGAELDKKVAAFSDATAEGRSLVDPRLAFRSALDDHAAKTFAMQDAFGDEPTSRYVSELRAMQTVIEATADPTTLPRIQTAWSRVIKDRRELAKTTTKKATS